MKVIDGKNARLGRLASYVAKEALRGEEIAILNCEQILITGNKKDIKKDFRLKKSRIGSGQKGPKHSKLSYMIVKRTIRGMLPNHRAGRGKDAFKKIKCYSGVPKDLADSKKIVAGKKKETKFVYIGDILND